MPSQGWPHPDPPVTLALRKADRVRCWKQLATKADMRLQDSTLRFTCLPLLCGQTKAFLHPSYLQNQKETWWSGKVDRVDNFMAMATDMLHNLKKWYWKERKHSTNPKGTQSHPDLWETSPWILPQNSPILVYGGPTPGSMALIWHLLLHSLFPQLPFLLSTQTIFSESCI